MPRKEDIDKLNSLLAEVISLDNSYDCERDIMIVRPIVKKETVINKEMNLNI